MGRTVVGCPKAERTGEKRTGARSLGLIALLWVICILASSGPAVAAALEVDTLETSGGALRITFVGHGSLMFSFGGKIIHVDPDTRLTDYAALPKADLIVITHEHKDHLDAKAVEVLRKEKTIVVVNQASAASIAGAKVMKNGDTETFDGVKIEAVPAYNIVHMRGEGVPFHPKGAGNGYVLAFGDKKVYVAGDTENIPEMKDLKGIDVAFLPMNLPYTMTPEMTVEAARSFKPKILYPYHFGDTDTAKIVELLKGSGIEVRVRQMK